MEKAVLDVPKMYADHHVLAVREILSRVAGVEDIVASSAMKRLFVTFDPAVTSRAAIEQALGQAGYGPGDPLGFPAITPAKDDGSFWYVLRPRVTKTNRLDIEMSGDFRKY